jgi:hypothetical protein
MTLIRKFVLAFALFGFAVTSAKADVFTVENVAIDGHGSSVTAARLAAIKAGTEKAANILIERLTLLEDRFNIGWQQIDSDIASQLVAGIQISDERRSDRRYLGVLQVTFNRQRVRDFLNSQQLPFVEAQTAPGLVIPVWNGPEGSVLWQENIWWKAWASSSPLNDLTPLTLPLADLGDQQALNVGQALRLDRGALLDIAVRYDVKKVVVAIASITGPGRVSVKVNTIQWDDTDQLMLRQRQVIADGNDVGTAMRALSMAGKRAKKQIISMMQTEWKQRAIVRGDTTTTILVTVSYANIQQWLLLREVLASSALVREARLDALSADGALMTLTYVGTEQQLTAQLAESGVDFLDTNIGLVARLR